MGSRPFAEQLKFRSTSRDAVLGWWARTAPSSAIGLRPSGGGDGSPRTSIGLWQPLHDLV